ncbi:MAG: dihydrodipicolinate synthase family protein [Brevinematia bacterium]
MQNFEILKEKIKGVIVVMITPFKENYELDEEGLRRLTRFLIDSGIKEGKGVLVPAGSTGECAMLSDEERKRIFQIVKDEAKKWGTRYWWM